MLIGVAYGMGVWIGSRMMSCACKSHLVTIKFVLEHQKRFEVYPVRQALWWWKMVQCLPTQKFRLPVQSNKYLLNREGVYVRNYKTKLS